MTSLPLLVLREIQDSPAREAWAAIIRYAWDVCSPPIAAGSPGAEIARREQAIAAVDLFVGTGAWELWSAYEKFVPRTAPTLAKWWRDRPSGRAVLILDGLSLRETPWLLAGAKDRGFVVHSSLATGAELPCRHKPVCAGIGVWPTLFPRERWSWWLTLAAECPD